MFFRRVKGDRAENVETAILLSESVLDELKPDELPEIRATLHGNLGNYYAHRVGTSGGRSNVDSALQHYSAALSFVIIPSLASESSGEAICKPCDGKVVHETQYFADPFEAPAWRRQRVQEIA